MRATSQTFAWPQDLTDPARVSLLEHLGWTMTIVPGEGEKITISVDFGPWKF